MEPRRVEKKDRSLKEKKNPAEIVMAIPDHTDQAMEGIEEEEMEEDEDEEDDSELPDPSLAIVRSAGTSTAADAQDDIDLIT